MKHRSAHLTIFAVLLLTTMGVDADGCSSELESDGVVDAWPFAELPEAGEPQPMTCEWVDGDNCWKEFVADLQSCLPSEQGTFNDDRNLCSFPDDSSMEWDGSVNVPEEGLHFPFIQHRYLDPEGEPCMTAKWLGPAHVAFDVQGKVTVLEADSLTSFQLTCSDGSTYRNDVEGGCPDLGAKWLNRELPGYDNICDGDTRTCSTLVNGSGTPGDPRIALASCGY